MPKKQDTSKPNPLNAVAKTYLKKTKKVQEPAKPLPSEEEQDMQLGEMSDKKIAKKSRTAAVTNKN